MGDRVVGQLRCRADDVLLAHGEWVVEVDRPKRPARRNGAKFDELDAIRAGREALSASILLSRRPRRSQSRPRAADHPARRGAARARTKAINHLKALVVTAREELRHQLRQHAHRRARPSLLAPAHAALTLQRAPRHRNRAAPHRPTHPRARGRASGRERTGGVGGLGGEAPWGYIMPPMPPMPPMSGMPPPLALSGISATIASVVRMFLAIDAAFWSAERVTIAGSITPAPTRSTISPVAAFKPWPLSALRTSLTTTEPSSPAFSAIWRSGSSSARRTIRAPVFSSSIAMASRLIASLASSSATPPPGTMPSSSAARVACRASSTRCFFSFISVSVA